MLEGPATVLARLQAAVRQGKDARGVDTSLVDELFAERAADTSLHTPTGPEAQSEAGAGPDAGEHAT